VTRWFYASIALAVAALGLSLYVYFGLYDELSPQGVPIHWNAEGQADGFVPRDRVLPYLLLVPGAMAAFLLLTLALPWLSPKHFEIDRFRGTYGYLMFLIQALFLYLHAAALAGSLKWPVDTGQLIIGGICLFFALMGNVMGKIKRNFYVGVRTPWTLASDAVWNQTHRVAAWLWVAGGMLSFFAIFLGVPFWWIFIVIMFVALAPVLYSLILYKHLEKLGKLTASSESPDEKVNAL
jgi:uncharacterized membrane protein